MSGHRVRKLSRPEADGLRDRLEADGFTFRSAPHALWSAGGPGVSVTYYKSGKLLAQGKGADDFGATYLEAEDFESAVAAAPPEDRVTGPTVGSDETGKGDYFGPLVVAGFLVLPEDVPVLRELGVRDSKQVSDSEARAIAAQLRDGYGDRAEVIAIGPARYNELHGQFGRNLNRLLAWAHGQVIEAIRSRHTVEKAVVDRFANEKLVEDQLRKRGIEICLEQRPRAESHPAVAAASILARARFLGELERLGRECGMKLPKGAGDPVDAVARRLFHEGGLDRLRPVAKLHFRNTLKAQGLF